MWLWQPRSAPIEQIKNHILAGIAGFPLTLDACRAHKGTLDVILSCDTQNPEQFEPIRQTLAHDLEKFSGIKHARILLTATRPPAASPPPATARKAPQKIDGLAAGVKHIIAVASGKGGVGKSTVATNLAVTLAAHGIKTGLLDADIYGPSIPMMMGQTGVKPTSQNGKLLPISAHHVACMSIGFMVDPESPMIWRGPMVQSAIIQMLRDVDWSGVDVLVIDLPPGTGDAQLTLAQKLNLSGVVIVSTPQDVALIDARKGLEMFRKVNVPILGIIQNMGLYCCPNCGHESAIFGTDGAQKIATELGVPFLGDIPITPQIRTQGDAGIPITALPQDDTTATTKIQALYADIAQAVLEKIGVNT